MSSKSISDSGKYLLDWKKHRKLLYGCGRADIEQRKRVELCESSIHSPFHLVYPSTPEKRKKWWKKESGKGSSNFFSSDPTLSDEEETDCNFNKISDLFSLRGVSEDVWRRRIRLIHKKSSSESRFIHHLPPLSTLVICIIYRALKTMSASSYWKRKERNQSKDERLKGKTKNSISDHHEEWISLWKGKRVICSKEKIKNCLTTSLEWQVGDLKIYRFCQLELFASSIWCKLKRSKIHGANKKNNNQARTTDSQARKYEKYLCREIEGRWLSSFELNVVCRILMLFLRQLDELLTNNRREEEFLFFLRHSRGFMFPQLNKKKNLRMLWQDEDEANETLSSSNEIVNDFLISLMFKSDFVVRSSLRNFKPVRHFLKSHQQKLSSWNNDIKSQNSSHYIARYIRIMSHK